MAFFDDVAPDVTLEKFIDEDIEIYLKSRIHNKENIYDLTHLNEAMVGQKFLINFRDLSTRTTAFCANIFMCLDAIGYEGFKLKIPENTIKVLLERIKLPALNNAMFKRIKVKIGLEKNVRLFITQLNEDAKLY